MTRSPKPRMALCRFHSGLRLLVFKERFDLFKQCGKQIFFLQTGHHILAAIYRTVAGHNNHRNVGIFLVDALRQFDTDHAIHAEVSHQDVKILFVEFAKSLLAVVSAHSTIALHLQDLAAQPRENFMIVNKQDGSHSTLLNLDFGRSQRLDVGEETQRPLWFVSNPTEKDACKLHNSTSGAMAAKQP